MVGMGSAVTGQPLVRANSSMKDTSVSMWVSRDALYMEIRMPPSFR